MKLPSNVKVNGYNYKIVEVPDPVWLDNDPAYGFCDFDTQKITVNSKCTFERKQHILLHEIMHAVFQSVHLSTYNLRNGEIEEYIITHSAPVLVEVLKNNPKVSSYLTHKGK